jgi:hypothetical protein
MLRTFIGLFPSSPLSQILKGYFSYANIPIIDEDEHDSSNDGSKVDENSHDSVDMMLVREIFVHESTVGSIIY